VSALVLNFVPDPQAALREMIRVTVNGGRIGAYLWDYSGKMELLRYFWDAAIELDPDARAMDEGIRFPICRPESLTKLFAESGLRDVEITAIDIDTRFNRFEEYWQPFLGGQGPAPAYAMSLTHPARDRLRDHLRERLPVQPDGSISMIARAWAIRAVVTK